jgi:hypothetical protein
MFSQALQCWRCCCMVSAYLLNWVFMPCFFFPLLMYLSYTGILWIWSFSLWIRSLQVRKNLRQCREWSFPMWFHRSLTLEFHPVELPDRSVGSTSVLPVSARDKDTKLKEENTRLLNGNSMDSADRVWNYHDEMFYNFVELSCLLPELSNIVMLRCRGHEHKWMESKLRMKAMLIVKLWKHDQLSWRGFC